MQYYDVYDWPKNFLEDSLMSENNELGNIFVDDYIESIINTKIDDFDENKLEELLTLISKLASFFSRLRVSLDEALGCLLYTSPSPRDAHESRMPSSA